MYLISMVGALTMKFLVAHIAQAVRYRMWYLLYTAVLCGIIEILGWSGRLWSSWNPFLDTPFQIQ